MNKVKWIVAFLILGGAVYAQKADDFKNCTCHISSTKLVNAFPFTDLQKQKLTVLQQAYAKERAQLKQDIAKVDAAIKATLKQEPIDELKLKGLVEQKINLVSQKMHSYYDLELSMFKVLNAEQKKQWHEIFDTPLSH